MLLSELVLTGTSMECHLVTIYLNANRYKLVHCDHAIWHLFLQNKLLFIA